MAWATGVEAEMSDAVGAHPEMVEGLRAAATRQQQQRAAAEEGTFG